MRALRLLALLLPLASPAAFAEEADNQGGFDQDRFKAMKWRNVGPFRGGRSTAVAGVATQPQVYYFGSTGGGLWKTEDAGLSWKNVSDGFFATGSVGAVAVAPSDPNVVYVGMGESPIRGVMSSSGDGVYRSTDAGKTWVHLGLEQTRQISEVRVHPKDPDLVYVAAQGNPWADTAERGIYRSVDGGENWELVLHVDQRSGASDLSMDPTNPRILYAGFWDHRRKPWKVISGGEGSSIHKSTDGGDTWKKVSKGLPELMGKIGVAVSPAEPERVWAMVEADEGGLFRSDDGGESWNRVNKERVLRARAWYYTHVFADPVDADTVYVLNAPMMKSTDGGRTFRRISTPHGDNHSLWINPGDNANMINGNDGGANVSFNSGRSWSTQANQPTAQFYRVSVDRRFPYHLYGGQQDNSTVAIASRTMDGGIGREDWYPIGGCESAHVAFDPDDPNLVYAGCYQGIITEYNRRLQQSRNIMAIPYLGLGSNPKDLPYRFNWNAPILVSHHDSDTIFHAGNMILKSTDRGLSWSEISPDLTRNVEENLGQGGGPITNEAAGGETYHTLNAVAESPHQDGVIWAGSDDGLVHLTRNSGADWKNVTPSGLEEGMINSIEISPHDPSSAYIAVARYKLGDFKPYIYKTEDFGESWRLLAEGIPDENFVRVVREDRVKRGLLYAGTERGLFISFDDGAQWSKFQLNLPVTPITDLQVHQGDLVASTQGRAFWILDDLSPLRQFGTQVAGAGLHLFKPRSAYRTGGAAGNSSTQGRNPPNGAILDYWLAEEPEKGQELKLEILDSEGELLRSYSSKGRPGSQSDGAGPGAASPTAGRLPAKEGLNRHVWNLRRERVARVRNLFVFGSQQGYRLAPGRYQARLSLGEQTQTQDFEVLQDPRSSHSERLFADQQKVLSELWDASDAVHRSVQRLRSVRRQVKSLMELTSDREDADLISEGGESLVDQIDDLEGRLVQPKQETFQDVINFPNQLNSKLLNLMGNIDGADPPVTGGSTKLFADLMQEWRDRRSELEQLLGKDLEAFNDLLRDKSVPSVIAPEK